MGSLAQVTPPPASPCTDTREGTSQLLAQGLLQVACFTPQVVAGARLSDPAELSALRLSQLPHGGG